MNAHLIPSPKVYGEEIKNMAEKLVDLQDDALERAFQYGHLTLMPSKPAERWQFYQDHTLADDFPLILDETYLERRKADKAQPFHAEILMQEYALQVAATAEVGLPMPPEPAYAYPWPVALSPGTADKVYELLAADFRKLWRAEQRRGDAA